jgi:uncharacterized protein DUF748
MWRPHLHWPRLNIRDRRLWVAGAIIVLVTAAVYALSFATDEPLRRSIERRMNARLKGYTVHLGGANFHPLGFSLDLVNLAVSQDANPHPPVMKIPRLSASVQWRELIRLKLVGNVTIHRPSLDIDLAHLREEAKEKVPVKERGWQDALQEAYPLKINELQIFDADITYVDPAKPFKPLRLTRLNVDADNIRNIKSPDRTYPSELHLRAAVFDTGKLRLDGNADFLAEPYPGVKATFTLDQMQMEYFQPVTHRYNVNVTGGVLSVAGRFEFTPSFTEAELEKVTVRGATVDYINNASDNAAGAQEKTSASKTAGTASANGAAAKDEGNTSKTAARAAPSDSAAAAKDKNASPKTGTRASSTDNAAASQKKEPASKTGSRATSSAAQAAKVDRPDVTVAIDRVDIVGSTLGYVNRPPGKPSYRVFFTDSELHLTGLTNQSSESPARAVMRGKFMGSGNTEATMAFRPHQKGGDLNLKVSIENTDMVAMNDLLRSYGKFEVAGGEFFLYSEVGVRDGEIRGYVKPLFKHMVVEHDATKDEEKTFGEKLKERVISGASKILKNRPRQQVATKADLSGRVGSPQTSLVQVATHLVQNAFFKAILPGFDQTVGSAPNPPRRPAAERASPPSRSS